MSGVSVYWKESDRRSSIIIVLVSYSVKASHATWWSDFLLHWLGLLFVKWKW